MVGLLAILWVLLGGLCLPPALTRRVRRRLPAVAALLQFAAHVVPAAAIPVGLMIIARDGYFVVALVAFAGYLTGAVRAAHLRAPRLTAEASLLHLWMEGREALTVLGRRRPVAKAPARLPASDELPDASRVAPTRAAN